MDQQEHKTINLIKSGDKNAFELLFSDYYPRLTVFAKKYVLDLDTAREIVQDYFVDLYESRETLNINSTLNNYLYTSVKNRCLNYLNKQKIHHQHEEQIRILSKDSVIDLQDKIEQTELEYLIWNEIAKLPEQCGRIFKLSRKEGIKNKDIADQLGISIRTVETQISKALKILRAGLARHLAILFL